MIKKRLVAYSASFLLVMLLLNTSTSSAIIELVEVEVGDTFEYKLTTAHIYFENNDVIYADDDMMGYAGREVEIEITGISEGLDGTSFGFIGNGIMFNTTETVGSDVYYVHSFLDDWYMSLLSASMLYALYVDLFDPTSYVVYPPLDDAMEYKGLPIFASLNTSFYNQILNEGIPGATVSFNAEKGNFTIALEPMEGFREGIDTSSLLPWNTTAKLKYYVNIDTEAGTVNDLKYSLETENYIGTNHTKIKVAYGFENLFADVDTNTFILDIPLIETLVASICLVTVISIWRRKK